MHAGYSGAALTRLRGADGGRFVLKRMSIERDWIMRATDDVFCREAAFAQSNAVLPEEVRTPVLDTADDGSGHALLMRDITADLLDPEVLISTVQLSRIIAAMSALHSTVPPAAVPWCDVHRRLTLLTPAGAGVAARYGHPVAADIRRGWQLFARWAPADVNALVGSLFDDITPLLRALSPLPVAFLHGDLKLDNIGFTSDGHVWLIDWAMTLTAPPAVDLGWFLAINSRRLPASLDDVIEEYATISGIASQDVQRHDALAVLCGLVLRGWRKALDAEAGEPAELTWWCERARDARRFL